MIGQAWLLAGAFAGGLLVAGAAQEWRWSADMEAYKGAVANDAKDRAEAVLLALSSAGDKVEAANAAVSKQRDENANDTAKQSAEIDRLNRCLKSGTCGLRVAAKCPSVPAGGSASSPGTDGDSQAGARLDAAAESDYLEFRRLYADQLNTLKLCKAYGETQIKKPSQ